MKYEAVALCRISSADQATGHSLEAQESSVRKMAKELDVNLRKENIWKVTKSSKAGNNITRKDLAEIKQCCKRNKKIKYLLIDRVSRLMREVEMMIVYTFELKKLGVKIIYCDPSQRHLNEDSQISHLMTYLEGFKAEQENKEKQETIISRMKARYEAGYYVSHPHQGYIKSDVPGLHIPDPERFELLQKACKYIIYNQYTVEQAVKWLNANGYRTRGGKKMETYHFVELFSDRYYCGFIDMKPEGWPKNVRGLHKPMLSPREHSQLLAIMKKRNPKKRRKYNPDFPLANILMHDECVGVGKYKKFAGVNFNPGKKNGRQRPKRPMYDCRACRKRVPRDLVHEHVSEHLASIHFMPDTPTLKKALIKVWKMQQGSVDEHLRALNRKKANLEQDRKKTTTAYVSEEDKAIKKSLKKLLKEYEEEMKTIDDEILVAQNVELESEGFVKFALDFVDDLRNKWWTLSKQNMERGVQILFNGKIYSDVYATIRTPETSTIYRLGANKKAPESASDAHLVELAGIAPASDGLRG